MPRTSEEQKEWELQAFGGFTQFQLDESKPEFVDNLMYATMILSDAQEEALHGDKETVRQYINRAKHFIHKEMHAETSKVK